MKRLMQPLELLTTIPAIVYDGGEVYANNTDKIPSKRDVQNETLPSYSDYHSSCFQTQMTLWGDMTELMENLATALCFCEYLKLEKLKTIIW